MKTSEAGLNLIKSFEGFSSKAYICPAGKWTIGYGHTKGVKSGQLIDEKEAEELLSSDIANFERSVLRLITVELEQHEFDALVSFAFNLGAGALQRSTLRQKLNRDDREGAALQFPRWIMAGGVKSRGLLRRRIAEMQLFSGGEYVD